mgnify:FL=1
MKQKSITVLFAATLFLLGLAGTVKAQGHRSPWIAKWDSCILDKGYGHYRPHIPAGPYDYANEVPMRIYEDCPVHVDSLFYIRPGTKRTLKVLGHRFLDEDFDITDPLIPGLPKDHLGRHYLTNTETGRPFSEFDEIELPASDNDTYFPISFVHHPLTEGDPVYKDGYSVAIYFTQKVDGDEYVQAFAYQYFQKPTVTNFSYQRPGPGFTGQFTMTFQGELVKPENRVGYDTIRRINSISEARNWTNFKKYTAGAYYSLDDGETWCEATDKTVNLTQSQVENLPEVVNVKMRLPGGCGSFFPVGAEYDPNDPSRGRRPDVPFSITRQITLNNETGDASSTLLEPLKQIYDVATGKDFTLTVRPTGNNVPTLTTSRNGRLSDEIGVKTEVLPDGAYRFTVRKVQENLTVTLKYTVSNAEVDGTRVWGEDGTLCITSAAAGRANIYNALGHFVNSLTLSAGETRRLTMPVGIYIVKLDNGRAYKAAVR